MSNLAFNSSSAKDALLKEIDVNVELKHEWSENDYANMDMLEEHDLAECILLATIQGRVALVRTLMDRCGPIKIVVEEGRDSGYTLNGLGIRLDTREFGAYAFSPKELKSVLAMVDEFGMKGLVEPGTSFPLLLSNIDYSRHLVKHNRSRFEGRLPELLGGVLGQPELAIALHDEASRVATPDAYKPMLCWASPAMVAQFPNDLSPLVPFQEVEGHGSMAMWKAGSGEPGNLEFREIEFGVGTTDGSSQEIHCVFSAMAPESARFGFKDEKGRVLCDATSDFLLSFPAKPCAEDNLTAASAFVENYFPVEIMALQAAEVCRRDFGVAQKNYYFKDCLKIGLRGCFNPLFSALRDAHPLHERIRDLMTRDQWNGLFQKAKGAGLDAASLVGMYEAFGIDNTGKGVPLKINDFELLVQAGYQFAGNTKVYEDHLTFAPHELSRSTLPAVFLDFPENTPHALMLQAYRNVLKTNLWPGPGEAPADMQAAFKKSSCLAPGAKITMTSRALEAYFVNAGLEACAASAKTPNQWVTLTRVFSCEEMKPYLQTMPGKARGKVLEAGLGL
jgi:hypothetical protein